MFVGNSRYTRTPPQIEMLRGRYNQPIKFMPGAREEFASREREWLSRNPLNPALDWAHIRDKYNTERTVVIDDLFSAEAWSELWRYLQQQANFWCVVTSCRMLVLVCLVLARVL